MSREADNKVNEKVIKFNFNNLSFERSIKVFYTGDSIATAQLGIKQCLFDSIISGIKSEEQINNLYVIMLFLDQNLNKAKEIGYDNILGFSTYSVRNTTMYHKLFFMSNGVFKPDNDYTCKASHIYCNDNNMISSQFVKRYKSPVTWFALYVEKEKEPLISCNHELTERLKQMHQDKK